MAHIPFGYRITDGKAVIDSVDGEKVKNLYKYFLDTESMRQAAVMADINKVHSSIGRILKNPVYLGQGFYPGIIDHEIYEKAQILRQKNCEHLKKNIKPKPVVVNTVSFKSVKTEKIYDDPYRQAEYAYGLIQEEITYEE